MTDKPIGFSSPMVRALLAGNKTQTRRELRLRGHKSFSEFGPSDTMGYDWHFRDAEKRWHDHRHESILRLLPIATGDRLYVREHWRAANAYDDLSPSEMGGEESIRYEADQVWQTWGWPVPVGLEGRFRQGMHMPRWASRLALTVTDVRIQRLQEISAADAIAEGVECHTCAAMGESACHRRGCFAASAAYRDLWNSLHGSAAWDANPWVAAYTLTVAHGNIDQIKVTK